MRSSLTLDRCSAGVVRCLSRARTDVEDRRLASAQTKESRPGTPTRPSRPVHESVIDWQRSRDPIDWSRGVGVGKDKEKTNEKKRKDD